MINEQLDNYYIRIRAEEREAQRRRVAEAYALAPAVFGERKLVQPAPTSGACRPLSAEIPIRYECTCAESLAPARIHPSQIPLKQRDCAPDRVHEQTNRHVAVLIGSSVQLRQEL